MRLLLLLCLIPFVAVADPVVTGPPQTVFDWTLQRCDQWDSPDSPARAWRDENGITLLTGAERTRFSQGAGLDTMRRNCRIVQQGGQNDATGAFDDRTWIASPYIEPSGRLTALAHVEYHGHARPDHCQAARYASCWWNSITELVAPDFRPGPDGASLVAALPIPYSPGQISRRGYFNPSNIIQRDGYLYAFIFAEKAAPQNRGACLIRRPLGGSPDDWRAWDGTSFATRFADPYRDAPLDPSRHVCIPLPGITSTISSVVKMPDTDRYMAVTPATLHDADHALRSGIWWMTSPDLIHWTRPRLLIALPLMWRRDCGTNAAYAYPSLLDSDSPTANFETVDGSFWLYLARIHLEADCRAGPRRDLIRFPVSRPLRPAD